MFKLGRGGGGGRGGGKRPLPQPPPSGLHRPSSAAASGPGSRLPTAAARNRPGRPGTVAGAAGPAREENFSLESRGPPDFAAIIRLAPYLVEEIRRTEAQGGVARIKFDANPNNPAENVIDVGGKEFKFTWSQELGDLCDIYEERRNGDDGHGLLVESGSAWRKLNVQRILDESTKNHVKMRSEEAERLSKSRKAIVLDPANPSVQNQAKAMVAAAVEGNTRRMGWKSKDNFFKKRKVEPHQVSNSGPPKSVFKSGTSSNNANKVMQPSSPQPSTPEQAGPGISVSPVGTGTSVRAVSNLEDMSAPFNINKEETSNFEKEMPSRVTSGVKHDLSGNRDLRSILISLLAENPKGMTLKALEKAVGETIPNPSKQIESMIKNIATFQTPGRYFLKPGLGVESSKRRAPEFGSSSGSAHDHTSVGKTVHAEKAPTEKCEQQPQSSFKAEEADPSEKIDGARNSPDPFSGDRRIDNDSEGRAGSSSESGSDSESESDSSDSGSDRSKSGSPVISGSASSSDSESDDSSSSKEGSDVDVDILTSDDEKEEAKHRTVAAEPKLPSSPREWRTCDGDHEQDDSARRNQEGRIASPHLDLNNFESGYDMADAVEVTEDFPASLDNKASENPETGNANGTVLDQYQINSRFSEKGISLSPDQQKQSKGQQSSYVRSSENNTNERVVKLRINEEKTEFKDGSGHELADVTKRVSKPKSKRASESGHFQEKAANAKRSKTAVSAHGKSSEKGKEVAYMENSHVVSAERPKQDQHNEVNDIEWDGNTGNDSQDYSPNMRGQSIQSGNLNRIRMSPDFGIATDLDAERLGQRTGYVNGRKKALDTAEKSSRSGESFARSNKHTEGLSFRRDDSDMATKSMHVQDKFSMPKDRLHKDICDENHDVNDKYSAKNARVVGAGDKLSSMFDSYNRKSGERSGMFKSNGQPSRKQTSDVNKPLAANGKGSMLRRELSDLELGEFREPPVGEEFVGVKRQPERKGSFKSSENKITTAADNSSSDVSKRRTAANALHQSKQQSPLSNSRGGIHGNQDGFYRKMPMDDFVETMRPQQRAILSQNQQNLRVDHADSEAMSYLDRSAEITGRNEMRMSQGTGLENHVGPQKKNSSNMLLKHDSQHGDQMGYANVGESKARKSNGLRDSKDQSKSKFSVENDTNGRKRTDSSSDEDTTFYLKYDKDEPELRGPIKEFSQYKEYVQEYREKYDIYYFLIKNMEKITDDFRKVGHDLEVAKGRDMEESVKEKLREMFRQWLPRQKQMKKVFMILHEELKTIKQRLQDFAEACPKE